MAGPEERRPSRRQDQRRESLPDVHPELEGFDVELNSFGEVDMTIGIDELNDFLDKRVDDPKLRQWGLSEADEEDPSDDARET